MMHLLVLGGLHCVQDRFHQCGCPTEAGGQDPSGKPKIWELCICLDTVEPCYNAVVVVESHT